MAACCLAAAASATRNGFVASFMTQPAGQVAAINSQLNILVAVA